MEQSTEQTIERITCELCGNAYPQDPMHPGFPAVHKCFRATRELSVDDCSVGKEQLDEQYTEPEDEELLSDGEEVARTEVNRMELLQPPKCSYCGIAPARLIAQELVMGNLQCIVFSCADCRNVVNVQCVGQISQVVQPRASAMPSLMKQ